MVQRSGQDIVLENARILFRNFAGAEKDFNSAGDRNFCVILPDDIAEELAKEGWNVKELKAREEGDIPEKYVKVKVNYGKGRPPRCVIIRSNGKMDLGADEIEMLDYIAIKKVDMILNPWPYNINGNSGVSIYLRTIFVTLDEDPLELKYADVQDTDDVPERDIEEA